MVLKGNLKKDMNNFLNIINIYILFFLLNQTKLIIRFINLHFLK